MDKAWIFASDKHSKQKRKFSGEPYFTHCVNVYKTVRDTTTDNEIAMAALLHDTLEDTDTTVKELRKTFGDRVAELVQELSNDPREIERVGKTQHLADKIIKLSDDALLIKLADRINNLSDLSDNVWSERYVFQTFYVFCYGLRNRKLTDKHEKLLQVIEKILQSYTTQIASKDMATLMCLLMLTYKH